MKALFESDPNESGLGVDSDGPGGSSKQKEIIWTSLQEAAKIDRTNPAVGQEIAFQWRKNTMPPGDLVEVLRFQLANDLATTPSRLMIAELYLIKGQLAEAKAQWEAILAKDPNVLPALNNLAVNLSRETPPKLSKAIEYIERAYRMDAMNPEISDTYGEVYLNAGRPLDAISKFEEAIRADGVRSPPRGMGAQIATRRRLMASYRELGREDLAKVQESQIQLMEESYARSQQEAAKKFQEAAEAKKAAEKPASQPSPAAEKTEPPKTEPPKPAPGASSTKKTPPPEKKKTNNKK